MTLDLLKSDWVILMQDKNNDKWNSRNAILKLQLVHFREAPELNNDQSILQHWATVAVGRNAPPICLTYNNCHHVSLTCDVQTRLLILVVTLQRLCRQSKQSEN